MRSWYCFVLAALVLSPSTAFAHPGDMLRTHAFADGLLHPLTGLDHLLAMIAVGAWGAMLGRTHAWFAPAGFVVGMAIGVFCGGGLVWLAPIEAMIAISVVALGLLLAFSIRLPLIIAIALCALAGLVHGASHASEASAQTTFIAFAIGALTMTLMLHVAGAYAGLLSSRLPVTATRAAGAAITVAGLTFLVST